MPWRNHIFPKKFVYSNDSSLSAVFGLLFSWTALGAANAETSLVIPASSWAVIGPFDYPIKGVFEPVYPPEYGRIRLDASYSGKMRRQVTWKRLVWMEDKDEALDFARLFANEGGIAYAFTTLHSTRKRRVFVEIESVGQVKIWINGTQAIAYEGGADSLRGAIELAAGWNQILAKSYGATEKWRLLVRIESMSEESLTDIRCQLPEEYFSINKPALLSLLLPGLGHMYLGEVKKGLLLLGGEAALLSSSLLIDRHAFDPSLDNDIGDFLSNPPLIAATELPLLSVYLAYRKVREKNHNIGYKQPLPDESLQDLAKAPFDPDIIAEPNFFLPFMVHFGVLFLLETSMGSDNVASSTKRARDDVRVYGKNLHPSIGYPLGEAGMWLSFTAVSMGEEAFFRGYLQSELEEILGKHMGWLTASAMFGIVHFMNGNTKRERTLASLSAFTGGLVMGYFFQRDGYSLRKPIAYHTWWNFSLGTINFLRNPEDSIISGNIAYRF